MRVHGSLKKAAASCMLLAGLILTTGADTPKTAPGNAPAMSEFVYFLRAPRVTFDKDATPEESAKVGEHFQRLKAATAEGKVILAGPCTDMVHPGIVVFRAKDESEAKAFMKGDPAVKAGVFTAELAPFKMALYGGYNKPAAVASERAVEKSAVVRAPIADVWNAWTTMAGLESWIVQKANVELRVGGPYEWFFNMQAPEGERGSEGMKVLSYVPMQMISFEWNAPPTIPEIRNNPHRCHVTVFFDDLGDGRVRVRLTELGWQDGPEWDKAYAYFDNAWGLVMKHFEETYAK